MTLEFRVCVQDTVCGGVVSRRIHGIGSGLVERRLRSRVSCILIPLLVVMLPYRKSHIPRLSTGNCDHGVYGRLFVWELFSC
jgi:hypothetical protein